MKSYTKAAELNPEDAAGYYFNAGAVLTNIGKVDDANAMFDKCIAADPKKAEAYYQKGLNLMGKATLQGDKMVPAPGTVEAFQKYLEVAPTGPNAQNAKAHAGEHRLPRRNQLRQRRRPRTDRHRSICK